MQLFYTYFVLVSNANYCCLVYLSSSWCCFRANQMLACMSIQYVLCCSAINPFAFEIYITLFVSSFICLSTLKELHCISHPLFELIVICPSSILHHKEQRKKISTTAFTLNQSHPSELNLFICCDRSFLFDILLLFLKSLRRHDKEW
jgi:hypothetical protein